VFAAGSFQYTWGLDGYGHPTTPVDPRRQTFTQNMLNDLSSGSTPPVNTTPPSITGSAVQGQTLAASNGSWTGYPAPTFSYQWQRCDATGNNCQAIASAIGQTYPCAVADPGSTLDVVVTGTNGAGSALATSSPTAVVTAAPVNNPPPGPPVQASGPPVVSGGTTPVVTVKPKRPAPPVRITQLAVHKVRGRYVLQIRLSGSVTLTVTLKRLHPHPKITIQHFKRKAKAGTHQFALAPPAGHNAIYAVVVTIVQAGAGTARTTSRSITFTVH
jgi:hypothetical protein